MVLKKDGPEKVDILIDMNTKTEKATITFILTTRAGFSQPQKFKPVVIEAKPTDTLGAVRQLIILAVHGATGVDADKLMIHTLKAESGFLFGENLNSTPLHALMSLAGGNRMSREIKLNMVIDGYGEGGGKRVSLTEPH